jgi:hypothetical protein
VWAPPPLRCGVSGRKNWRILYGRRIGPIRAALLIALMQTPHRFAAGMRGGHKNGQHRNPSSKDRWGAECKSPQPPPLPRRAGEKFFLDILFHRKSALAKITGQYFESRLKGCR